MRKGFIFNKDLCVGCKACSAACMLENGWKFRARTIFSSGSDLYLPDPVINLSMSCNHCNSTPCLKGCPSGALYRHEPTGAVVINPEKCLGCKYCQWNCPYDAPKYDSAEGIMEKCHFCHDIQAGGYEPACSAGCPTGALSFGVIPEYVSFSNTSWMPANDINPSLVLDGGTTCRQTRQVPQPDNADQAGVNDEAVSERQGDWSLAAFTFLVTLSVSLHISSLFNISLSESRLPVFLASMAAVLSLFHLGSKRRMLMAASNLRTSPLSREIIIFGIYFTLITTALITGNDTITVVSALTGILLLLSVDSVYSFSAPGIATALHSGQVTLSGLTLLSYYMDSPLPFIFMIAVRLFLSVRSIIEWGDTKSLLPLRLFRAGLMIIAAGVFASRNTIPDVTVFIMVITGELADRWLFYKDFRPVNIKRTIRNSKINY